MTNPANPARRAAGRPTGSAVDPQPGSVHGTTAAWPPPTHVHAEPGEDTATTTSLPAIGGPQDPYAGSQRPVVPPAQRPALREPVTQPVNPAPPAAPAPPRPSAVDQYGALVGAAPGSGTALPPITPHGSPTTTPGVPAHAVPGAARMPSPAGAPVPPAATVRPAKAIRRPKTGSGARSPRRAKLQVRHLNVWSVLRFSCVLAIALFFVWLIMVGVLYGILDVTHVFDKVNETVRTINGDDNAKDVITPGIVFGGAFVIGLVNIVLFIVLSTIGSIVYNLCSDLVGGIEVTLSEHE